MDKANQQNKATLATLEQTAADGTSCVQQLESALTVCKEEIKVQLHMAETARNKHQAEITAKEQLVITLVLFSSFEGAHCTDLL